MRTPQHIITEINQFKPLNGNWLQLDALLNELWETGEQENFTSALLNVFERFPEEDGARRILEYRAWRRTFQGI